MNQKILGHPRSPRFLDIRASKAFILLTVCVAIFTDAFIYGVVVPVIPFSLHDRSGVAEDDVQWWTSLLLAAFGVAILIGSPFCGWYADRYHNRRIPFFVGLIIMSLSTILFGVARSPNAVLLSRIGQGLSTSIVYTIGCTMLVDTVGRDEVGQWMGTALSSSSAGLIISPMLGGLVYFHAGFFAVIGMAIALICIDILLRMLMIERRDAAMYMQKATSGNGHYGTFENGQQEPDHLPDPVNTDIQSEDEMDSSESTIRSVSGQFPSVTQSSVSTVSTISRASVASSEWELPPVITLLGSPRLLAAIYGVFVNVSVLAAFDSVLPVFVKLTFHWSSLESGLIFITLAVPALVGPLVGQLSDRFGARAVAMFGCIATSPSLILLQFVTHKSKDQVILLCGLLTLIGCTLVFIISPLAADLSFIVEQKEKEDPDAFGEGGAYASAYALFNCSMAAATMFGPVLAGWLVEQYGWPAMAWGMGVFCLSGSIPCFLFTGDPVSRDRESDYHTVESCLIEHEALYGVSS